MQRESRAHSIPKAPAKRSSSGIQAQLISLLLVVLLPVLAAEALIYSERYGSRRELVKESNLEVARAVSRTFEYFIEDLFHHELTLGYAVALMGTPSVERIEQLFDQDKREHASIYELAWVSPEGRVFASTRRASEGEDVSRMPFFDEIKCGKGKVLGDLFPLRKEGRGAFNVSHGIWDENGALLGMVVATLDPKVVGEILSIERDAGGAIGISDSKGMAVVRFPRIEMSWEERDWLNRYPILGKALAGAEVTGTIYSHRESRNRMFAAVPVGLTGWAATAGVAEVEAMEPVLSRFLTQGLLFLFVALCGFILALFLSRRIIVSTRELQRYAQALGDGKITEPLSISGPAELSHLADAFHGMAQSMRSREQALLDIQEHLEQMVAERTGELSKANEVLRAEIAEREGAQEALKEERKRLFSLLDGLPAFVYLRAPDHSLRFTNSTFRRSFGEVDGRLCFEALTRSQTPCEGCPSQEVLRTGKPFESEWAHSGSGNVYQVYSYPFRDVDGTNLVMELGIDITRRKQAEESLKESEKRFRELAENIREVFWVKSSDEMLYVSPAYEEIWGRTRESLYEHPDLLSESIHPEDHVHFLETYAEWLEHGKFDAEFRIIRPDGQVRWIWARSYPVKENGRITRTVGIAEDITKRKLFEDDLRASEEQLRALSSRLLSAQEDERKSLAGEIHDSLGSSLSAIKLVLENTLWQMKEENDPSESLKTAISWTQHAIEEARRIMMDLRPSILDDMGLLPTLDWFLRQYRTSYPGIHIESDTRIEEQDIPRTLKIVIFRIVQEAFHNIGKYSRAELVEFSLLRKDQCLELTIEDNGEGFELASILSARGSSRKGLGLTSMRERAELSGGSFAIRSTLGEGTVVRATWWVADGR